MRSGRLLNVERQVDQDTEKAMKKKITVLTFCAILFALCFSASAQQSKKVPRIGIYRRSTQLVSPSVPSQFGWLCVRLAYRRTEHRYRLPIYAGEARSAT
jgi:hypothetical protein